MHCSRFSMQVRLGQVRLNQLRWVRICQVMLGQVRLCPVRLIQAMLDYVRSRSVSLGYFGLGYVRLCLARLGQVISDQVRLGQYTTLFRVEPQGQVRQVMLGHVRLSQVRLVHHFVQGGWNRKVRSVIYFLPLRPRFFFPRFLTILAARWCLNLSMSEVSCARSSPRAWDPRYLQLIIRRCFKYFGFQKCHGINYKLLQAFCR